MKMIDIHIHTMYSDGTETVSEVLKMAEKLREEMNLQIISIADHDDVLAYQELKKEEIRKLYKGTIIPAVELNFNLNNRAYDLLGYNIDTDKMLELLNKRANPARKVEIQREILKEFKEMCNRKGIEYNSEVEVSTGRIHEALNTLFDDISDYDAHPNNIRFKEYHIEKGNVNDFNKKYYSNPNSDFFVNWVKYMPTLKEAISMIHECGGKAFLAHSYVYGLENTREFIEWAIGEGIDGIEKYYGTHTTEQEDIIQEYADKYNLYISGGSDFHGEKIKPGLKIGRGYGNLNIPFELIEDWYDDSLKI